MVHGFIFSEVRKYVETKFDRETWLILLDKAGLGRKEYENFLSYPDGEVVGIVVAASELTGLPVPAILEDFGRFIGEDLLRIYRPLIDPQWRTLEFLLNIEQTIHHVVRTRNRQAQPPHLAATRTAQDEVTILYTSARKMSALGRGIVQGVAKHYGQEVEVQEVPLATDGSRCEIRVRLLAAP